MTRADTERACESCHATGRVLVAVPNGRGWTRLCLDCLERFNALREGEPDAPITA